MMCVVINPQGGTSVFVGKCSTDFRPISLINCDNKILIKLLSNRLAKVLPDLIHKNQTRFIKIGTYKQIQEHVLA